MKCCDYMLIQMYEYVLKKKMYVNVRKYIYIQLVNSRYKNVKNKYAVNNKEK